MQIAFLAFLACASANMQFEIPAEMLQVCFVPGLLNAAWHGRSLLYFQLLQLKRREHPAVPHQ